MAVAALNPGSRGSTLVERAASVWPAVCVEGHAARGGEQLVPLGLSREGEPLRRCRAQQIGQGWAWAATARE